MIARSRRKRRPGVPGRGRRALSPAFPDAEASARRLDPTWRFGERDDFGGRGTPHHRARTRREGAVDHVITIIVCLPTADRRTSFEFYRSGLGFEPIGELADDGVPEPLQFVLKDGVPSCSFPRVGSDGSRVGITSLLPAPANVPFRSTLATTQESTRCSSGHVGVAQRS